MAVSSFPERDIRDSGVAPVVGVILMVATTVILAAVIGTFVLGAADSIEQTEQAPAVSMSMDYDAENQTASLTYMGGNLGRDVTVFASDVEVTRDGWRDDWNGATNRGVVETGSTHTMSSVSPGTEIQVTVWVSGYEAPAEMTFTAG